MVVVDMGNTHTRLAAVEGGVVGARRRFATRAVDAGDLTRAFAELAPAASDGTVWIASVYPPGGAALAVAVEQAGLTPRFIRSGVDDIIPHTLETPRTTGVDRLLSAMAAGQRHFHGPGGYAVVQCGSAATVDWVDSVGVFRGGYILPGPALWLSSLAGAAQLPDLSAEPVDWQAARPGRNTREAILHAMTAGLPEAVASLARTLVGNAGPTPRIAVTGGWSEAVAERLGDLCVLDNDLLLYGVALFAERHSGERRGGA